VPLHEFLLISESAEQETHEIGLMINI